MRCVIYLRVSTREQAEKGDGEEGFSLPAQREACLRHIRDRGWQLVDEYSDRGESARTADRPQLQALLTRVAEVRDIDAVVVHKVDRLARNMEDHIAIRALLRRRGASLVSVTENIEETASGRLVEGIHALMAEFYSANLAAEVRKGMGQKAKQGGYPHAAPLGYLNVRETIGGRRICRMVIDPERAELVKTAFDLYATGDYTLEKLAHEMGQRGLRNRGRRDYPPKPLGITGLAHLLANVTYTGVVEWDGVEYPGQHPALVDRATFRRVQEVLALRAVRGIRDRTHNHYLKGLLSCEVCGRALSVQVSKRTYTYLYCLGQKGSRAPTGCREPYVPAERLETEIARLYQRIQLPPAWLGQLQTELNDEITTRQRASAGQREFLTRALAKAEGERRKVLDAYYAGAIDLSLLKTEQHRLGDDINRISHQLADADADLAERQEILDLAIGLAANCATAYAGADERTKRLFNNAVFTRITIKDGHLHTVEYRPPFDDLFATPGFEYGRFVAPTGFEPALPP